MQTEPQTVYDQSRTVLEFEGKKAILAPTKVIKMEKT